MASACNGVIVSVALRSSVRPLVRTRPMAPVSVAAPTSVTGVHHQHSNGLGLLLRSVESHLAHDLEWLEHEVGKDYSHAKHFIGDVFGHLEHVRPGRLSAHVSAR